MVADRDSDSDAVTHSAADDTADDLLSAVFDGMESYQMKGLIRRCKPRRMLGYMGLAVAWTLTNELLGCVAVLCTVLCCVAVACVELTCC